MAVVVFSMYSAHALESLEFPKVVAMVVGQSLTAAGKRRAQAIVPIPDIADRRKRLVESRQMYDIRRFGNPFPLERMEEIRPIIDEAKVVGTMLEPIECLQISRMQKLVHSLIDYEPGGEIGWESVHEYIDMCKKLPRIVQAVDKAIDADGQIKEHASPALTRLRRELQESKSKVISQLERQISASRSKEGWQDDVVTMRNGRYVVPIPTSRYREGSGILHDRSQSGQTMFVEPSDAVELNNRLQRIEQQIQEEIHRILLEITELIRESAFQLLEHERIIAHLDLLHSLAGAALIYRGEQCQLSEDSSVDLREARHPLLVHSLGFEKVISNSISVGADRQLVIISGPNTGGKTVAMKTIGLLAVMGSAGMLIPARDTSTVGEFSQIFVDIGDEQSLELSLSTFSSHMVHIIEAVNGADDRSLVLLDEVGVGTDPKEGAALAEVIILDLAHKGAKGIVTTHYSPLKSLPMEHVELENASMAFNKETLAPSYRLEIGIPGSSYAIEIARRLGLKNELCEKAASLIGSGERSVDFLIDSLQRELGQLRQDRQSLTERLGKATELESFYRTQLEKVTRETGEIKEKALAETRQLIDSTRKEGERLVAEIRTSQASQEKVRELKDHLKVVEAKLAKLSETKAKPKKSSITYSVGDKVRVDSLGRDGVIEALLGDDKARIAIGTMSSIVELRQLSPVGEQTTNVRRARSSRSSDASDDRAMSPEIHLRGMTVEEAMESLERYLDQAVLAGLTQVYVVHGKGTGTLRKRLTDFLRKHPEIKSLRLGDWNEGGAGVTIATLKS